MAQLKWVENQVGQRAPKISMVSIHRFRPATNSSQPRRGHRYELTVTIALRATLRRVYLGVLDCPTIDQLLKLLDLQLADGDKMASVE